VLVSGGGTTLQNFLDREAAGTLAGSVALVVSSDPDAGAVERARRAGKPCEVVSWRTGGSESFSRGVTRALETAKVDLVLMAGFLRLWRFPPGFEGRVLNIHPALLPAFGGKGMYGHFVHEAVVRSGVKVTGCTVHFADLVYDRGPIVLQRTCPVEFGDNPEAVAKRVFALEKEAYPEAVALWAAGRLRVEDGRVRVLPAR
jgi:formyltetrahydrofolate-dependent phosphoribosylglycinamide formyltransferase